MPRSNRWDFIAASDFTPAKKPVGERKCSSNPKRAKVGVLERNKLRQIAELKMKDLNANSVEQAEKIIEGSARSMGVTVE